MVLSEMLKLLVLVAVIMTTTCFEFENGFEYYESDQNQQDEVQSGLVDPPPTPTTTLPPTPTLPTPPPTLPTPPPTQPSTTPKPTTTRPSTPQPRRPTTNNTEFATVMSKLDDISGMLQQLNQSLNSLLQGPNTSVFMQTSCPTVTIQTTSTTTTSTTTPIPTIFESDFDSDFDNFPELPAFRFEEKKEEKDNAEVNSGVTAKSIFDVVARWFESTNNQILIATLVPSLIVVVLLMIVFCGYCCGDRSTTGQNIDLEVII